MSSLRSRILPALVLLLALSACGPATTPAPRPTRTPLQPGPSSTPTATVTPTVTPSPTPTGPATYAAGPVSFDYPRPWSEVAPGAVAGPGGFARLEVEADDGARPEAVCHLEANREKPARFGAFPEITGLSLPPFAAGCLVMPSADQPPERQGEALALLWLPGRAGRLALRADREHIGEIAASLRPAGAAAPAPGSTPAPPPPCGPPPPGALANRLEGPGLRVDEVPAAAGPLCDPLRSPDLLNAAALGPEAAARTERLINSQFARARLQRMNARLAPFGVQMWAYNRRFFIYQNGRQLTSRANWVGRPAASATTGDFFLPVVDSYDSGTYLVRPDGLRPVENWDLLLSDRVFPVWVGDDAVTLAYEYERFPRPLTGPALLNVLRNGEVTHTFSVSGYGAGGGPARALEAWEGHWVLELPGMVVEDGEILNDRLGYAEMFGWRLVNDRPIYFYRQNGKVDAVYDGQPVALGYDEVIYQPLSGMAILLQMRAYDAGLTFYARRGEVWYYVTIEVQ